ncbi:ATP citrate synthase [Candidatus Woesearchaeota archaeon]|nr:ATP citrate synthase [Candidatus Woesearchaeota archaeon]
MKFTKNTQALFYNLKPHPIQQMLDFDYLCRRATPSVAGIVHPGKSSFHKAFFGAREIIIPIYPTMQEAVKKQPQAEVLINFASFRSAYQATTEALFEPTVRVVVIVAEGLPERQARELIARAQRQQKLLLGPATVGGIAAGAFRLGGYAGGMPENLIRAKLYRPGSVGLVSKSGGMMNELFNIIARATDGIKEGLAIGGDLFPGSTLLEHLLRFEQDPEIKLMVCLGELGGKQENDIAEAKRAGKITKPLVMWVSGTSADIFPWEVQFGHAGAKSERADQSAAAKNQALRETGIIVPKSFEELELLLQQQYQQLVAAGHIVPREELPPPALPKSYEEALREGSIRKATNFITTISAEEKGDPAYAGVPITKVLEEGPALGSAIGLLWLKKKLPPAFAAFLERSIVLTADHGPAVSGAHNAIVAARAGKDVIASLCSGLLTIGPRFGGALDDACRYFKEAKETGKTPSQFVEEMKQKSIPIPGIGHRVKSKRNPDQRVTLLKEFAIANFPTPHLTYALEVEKITLQKAENLILNVDGCIAAIFLDALTACPAFSTEEIDQIVEIGYLNGLFAVARSIGLVGHILDQKRLKQELYRHPTDDILHLPD